MSRKSRIVFLVSPMVVLLGLSASCTGGLATTSEEEGVGSTTLAVQSGEEVVLDGSSLFGDSASTSFRWTQLGGPDISISTPTAATIRFTAPYVSVATFIVISLEAAKGDLHANTLYTITVLPIGAEEDAASTPADEDAAASTDANVESDPMRDAGSGSTTSPSQSGELAFSLQADRSSPLTLDGATLGEPVYVFLNVPGQGDIAQVDFVVTGPSGTVHTQVERLWPFDLTGGTVDSAAPWDTTSLNDGDYTLTATVQDGSGSSQLVANFHIADGGGATSGGGTTTDPGTPPAGDDHASLLQELEGFGYATTGGKLGTERWVTNNNDSGPGSLRAAAQASGAKWIRFDPSVFPPGGNTRISLNSIVDVSANTTIDGRGAKVIIQRHGFFIDADNVIVTNLIFDFAAEWVSFQGNNPLTIGWPAYGAERIWVHKNTFRGSGPGKLDGAVDILRGAHHVTVSWNRFDYWDKAALLGANRFEESEAADLVTFHHNYWRACGQRQPYARFNRFHVYNNWYEDWDFNGSFGQALVSTNGAQLLSERNIFDNSKSYSAIISKDEGFGRGYTKDIGSYFSPNVRYTIYQASKVAFNPSAHYDYTPDAVATSAEQQALRQRIQAGAGWQAPN